MQAQILELLQKLRQDLGLAIVLITHDLGVVAGMADRIAVMYGGRVVEAGSAEEIFYTTRHPYTRGLIAAVPVLDRPTEALVPIEGTPPSIWARPSGCAFHPRCPEATAICRAEDPTPAPRRRHPGRLSPCLRSAGADRGAGMSEAAAIAMPRTPPVLGAVLEVDGLVKDYPLGGGFLGLGRPQVLRAVAGVSFAVAPGETFGLVGESGCGKSTLGRCILRLIEPTAGQIRLAGRDLLAASPVEMRALRRDLQIVFQDPMASLHPSMTVRRILAEGMRLADLSKTEESRRIAELIEMVQLPQDVAGRYPHELSRRPAPAHRHCPGGVAGSEGDRAGRTGFGAGRVDPGRGAEPLERAAGAAGHGLCVHRP